MGGIKCEVDGILLKPNFKLYGNARARGDSYLDGTHFLSISFNNDTNTDMGIQYIRLLSMDADTRIDLTGRIFILGEKENGQSYAEYRSIEFDGATSASYNGKLEILYHDTQERIIGGKFWFDAANENNEIREIRKGEFDMFIN
ncbi:hypothetical protein JBL43_01275 [Aureibaculum sp. A20]|uniref:Uncharacterized protein n=1 Tax=Aureibaculum flavum TaxID=2795986 RepID=A0ABS0WLK7_9FLAO|nr:hypothetical protein [Aureibaculum flavum]MBJ2172848.1 hypothetical protein [Aureibaculum flavum]